MLSQNLQSQWHSDLTVSEVCAMLQVTAPTVYALMARGELKSFKAGRSRRITYESLQKLREGK